MSEYYGQVLLHLKWAINFHSRSLQIRQDSISYLSPFQWAWRETVSYLALACHASSWALAERSVISSLGPYCRPPFRASLYPLFTEIFFYFHCKISPSIIQGFFLCVCAGFLHAQFCSRNSQETSGHPGDICCTCSYLVHKSFIRNPMLIGNIEYYTYFCLRPIQEKSIFKKKSGVATSHKPMNKDMRCQIPH